MQIGTKEHYEMMEFFERAADVHGRKDREDKECWPKGRFYQHGDVNNAFLAFQRGVAYGRGIYLLEQD